MEEFIYFISLNNEPCVPVLQNVENFDWHNQDEFYSLRVFMILKNGIDYGRVIKLIGSELEYEEIFSSLEMISGFIQLSFIISAIL